MSYKFAEMELSLFSFCVMSYSFSLALFSHFYLCVAIMLSAFIIILLKYPLRFRAFKFQRHSLVFAIGLTSAFHFYVSHTFISNFPISHAHEWRPKEAKRKEVKNTRSVGQIVLRA